MSGFGTQVGLSFHEAMSGTLIAGVADPDKAALQAAGRPSNFKFSVLVDIRSLRSFLDSSTHVAELTRGAVYWEGICRPDTPIVSGGTIQMYRNLSPDGRNKDFRFTFSFRGDDGRWYTFDGQKRLADDAGLDMFQDLSKVFARIQADGQTIAAGVTSVHFDELVEQLVSMQVIDAQNLGEQIAARTAFFSFMNAELKQVYPSLPPLFHHDDRRFLRPSEWRALAFIAQAMLPDPLPADGPSIEDVVANVQSFVRESTAEALDEIRSLLRAIGVISPIFDPRHIRDMLRHHVTSGSVSLLDVMDRLKLLAAVPYYAHPRADRLVGYVRPSFTKTLQTRLATTDVPSTTRIFDLVIVGAGVAGSLLAARATAAGQSVLLLEAGPYQPEVDLTTDEIRMTSRLYKQSALQATRQSMTVLQPWCVGGGGLINNAICFQLPVDRLARWQAGGFPFGDAEMRSAYARVAADLSIKPVSRATQHLNPALRFLSALGPAQVPAVDKPPPTGLSECLVNLDLCDGLGLCNTGCGNERKRNAFQVYLKQALASGRCSLVADAQAVGLRLDGTGNVSALQVEKAGRRYDIHAKEFVLAAGAIASSALLLRSDVHTRLPTLPIGRRFSANVGCPAWVFSKTQLHTRPSLQIAHAYLPPGGEGYVIESWFAPPGTAALTMPGYFETHARRMQRYAYASVLAPLVGVAPTGTIRLDAAGRTEVDLPIGADDLKKLLQGSGMLARTALRSDQAGLDHIVLGTRFGHEVRKESDVDAFVDGTTTTTALRLGTGHPQGGNAMGTDPSRSVVDANFRVHGVRNLRVCDASVFPDVAGVNPQWTVMALAQLLGERL